ncbi:peptide-methionine (S)-S-oxide reductase MsrA [Oceanomicrobium pacificus]|uniref:Peptide methionine sulfoxide reductase MsrA n=1 Tax=Oceanomicrobium pacificus TaxID=2692916 RepID=A0A6B0TJL4_9RHOB|nr:peptide-methionine (S)-S-oxide reductase MsrA [Oceanomicrobium pacificus]
MRFANIRPFLLGVAIVCGLMLGQAADARNLQTAIFAGGCFWCVEADFDKVKGVVETTSGYTGGTVANPTYKQVTRGGTGHYEAVKIVYDADQVSYETLLNVFWTSVDPTDAGGQFCDRGESYRTAIFATTQAQADAALASKAALKGRLPGPIVTPIAAAKTFYPAEAYHQNYYRSQDKVLTRFGYVTKAKAYKGYRDACGRDARVKALWGADAFVNRLGS